MKNSFLSLALLASILYCGNALAAAPDELAAVSLSAGDRTDNLDWNIAGNASGSNPNILSELKWKDLEIFQLRTNVRAVVGGGLYIRGGLGYGWIYGGTNQDSDYSGDNRAGEYSRSNNNADAGTVMDFIVGLGYRERFAFKRSSLDVAPLAGYSQHRQNLRITGGYQTIPATGAFGGLDSSYNARWQGPWFGVDVSWLMDRLALRGGLEYHAARYHAEADWNLRSDFNHPKSFEHNANGTGVVFSFGGDYALHKAWAITGDIGYQKWWTSNGTDRTYFSNGRTSDTRLNEVNWESYSYMAGVKRAF